MYIVQTVRHCYSVLSEREGGVVKFGRSRRQLSTEVQCSGAGSLAAGRSLEVAVVRRFKMC